MYKLALSLLTSLLLVACNSGGNDTTADAATPITAKQQAAIPFTVTRAADVPASGGQPLALVARKATTASAAGVSSVPSYAVSSGVLTAGNVIVTSGGSNTCYNTTFSTTSTSPSITLALTSATQTTCPSTSNTLFDGTTLTLNEMNLAGTGSSACYDVTLQLNSTTQFTFKVTSVTASTCETAQPAVNLAALPLGDSKMTTTTPAVGYLYVCSSGSASNGGASAKGPWFNSDGTTWDATTKDYVSGAVSWVSQFVATLTSSSKSISGNGLPSHDTGTFPIPTTDAIHQYDGNPNHIATQTIAWGLPGSPQVASKPTCTPGGAIGVLLTGVRMYNAADGEGRDARAWEGQDACQGHPDQNSTYHYHNVSSCATTGDVAGQHSNLVGYAADGFAIFGNQGEGGVALTNANLDECHGHTHAITINGKTVVQYHYHATAEFPYSIGCFRGTPVSVH